MTTREDPARELLRRALAGAPAPGFHRGAWHGLEFLRADQPLRRSAACYLPSLCVVAQGRKVAHLEGGHRVDYDPLHFLIVALPLPLDAEILDASPERPFLAVRVGLDLALLAEVLAAIGEPLADHEDVRPALASSPLDARLLDVFLRILRACDDETERRVLLEPLQRELLFRLATGPQAGLLRQIVQRDHQAHRVAEVIRHIEAHFGDGLSIGQLARVARMGESTFHRAFRGVTGTTPGQYLKQYRLHHARNLMLNEDLTAAEAAGRVGYQSPSQFSREFKSLFGAAPRQAVLALRGQVGVR